ncbi:hypothetical protein AMS68_003859 [Peltaster fructicola]|uniref:F-box domain-containing protein n=1 Tax=Peltaster fructicola TaxID=286661 RepID=A0A6H0XUA4_9PEZI|nr:hypothetical protein AMS68_003859 [Peltaster fructicola]
MADRFSELPPELHDQILSLLEHKTLLHFAVTARWCHRLALPIIWREVELVDCETTQRRACPTLPKDYHDDTPIIRKLLVLASNKEIAQCVQILNHRCHLPPPSLSRVPWTWLGRASSMGQTLSYDPRLIRLVRLAVDSLKNIHTLRIVRGHARLTESLVRSVFDQRRNNSVSVRRLWLEDCHVSEALQAELHGQKHGLADILDFSGLESFRIRRLHLHPPDYGHRIHHRTEPRCIDGVDEWALAGIPKGLNERGVARIAIKMPLDGQALRTNIAEWFEISNRLDDCIFEDISKRAELPLAVQQAGIESHEQRAIWAYTLRCAQHDVSANRKAYSPDLCAIFLEKRPTPAACLLNLLEQCHLTLTSLTLDWLFMQCHEDGSVEQAQHHDDGELERQYTFYAIFRLRFPLLRAFQVRNFESDGTQLPRGIYLLDRCNWYSPDESRRRISWQDDTDADSVALTFLEAHPRLQCLAWPITRFFNSDGADDWKPTPRVMKIIDNLAIHLTDLRVDDFAGEGPGNLEEELTMRALRRSFIQHFVSRMTSIKHIKVCGYADLDEHREILRALYRCPLQRISVIGNSSSIGNTWGVNAADLEDEVGPVELAGDLYEVDKDTVWRLGFSSPATPGEFSVTYGWTGAAPMITTIAGYFGRTLRELKLIGSIGAPVLLRPTPITAPMLAGLKYMDNLEVLTMSLWISTLYEGDYRDSEVVEYWRSSKDPASTALMIVDQDPAERSSWQRRLDELEPSNLARCVSALFAPHLSEKAKRKGVHVRASLYINSTLHDMDVYIDMDGQGRDQPCNFIGPRDELDPDRRREKMDTRRWF